MVLPPPRDYRILGVGVARLYGNFIATFYSRFILQRARCRDGRGNSLESANPAYRCKQSCTAYVGDYRPVSRLGDRLGGDSAILPAGAPFGCAALPARETRGSCWGEA